MYTIVYLYRLSCRVPSGRTLIYRYAVSDQSEKLKFRHSSPYSHVQPHFVAMTHFKSSFSEGTQLPTRVSGNSHIYINACVRFSSRFLPDNMSLMALLLLLCWGLLARAQTSDTTATGASSSSVGCRWIGDIAVSLPFCLARS